MSEMRLDKGGRLTLPSGVAHMVGDRPLRLASSSIHHLLLVPVANGSTVQMAGLIGDVGIVDLLSFFNMFRKSGELHFTLAGGSKTLYFKKGEISHASSTFPEEEIGEILYSLGKLDRKALQGALRFVDGELPLGKILVDQNIITPKDLWAASRNQVETIVYNLFAFHEGTFVFVDTVLPEDQLVSLSMNTQNLIMEGLRRVDERAVYMQKVKSLEALPVVADMIPNDLDSVSQKMVALIQAGVGDVRELLRRSGSGEFDALRLLSQMVERGIISIEEAPTVIVEGVLGEVVTIFNGVLVAMHRVVSAKNPKFREEVSRFLRDLPQPFSYVFRRTTLREDGSVDGGRMLANLAGLEEGDKLRLLAESLSELIYMECIAARRELGAADSGDLIKRVQEVSTRVQALIGKRDEE